MHLQHPVCYMGGVDRPPLLLEKIQPSQKAAFNSLRIKNVHAVGIGTVAVVVRAAGDVHSRHHKVVGELVVAAEELE